VSCGVGLRCSSDPTLLWLWCRPAAAALIRFLAWKLPCAVGLALKRPKKKKKKKKERKRERKGLPRRKEAQFLVRSGSLLGLLFSGPSRVHPHTARSLNVHRVELGFRRVPLKRA